MFDALDLFNDISFVYEIIVRIFCVGLAISSLEYLLTLNEYSGKGIFAWKVFKLTPIVLKSRISDKVFDVLFEKTGLCIIIVIRLVACLWLLVYPLTFSSVYLIAFVAVTSLLLSFRNIVGMDGSDQMNSIICLTLFISLLLKEESIIRLGLYFICAQAILSYVVAGLAKLLSIKWRTGMATYEIMNTMTYGNRKIASTLKNLPRPFVQLINWSIIVFECSYFFSIFLPFPFFLIFLIGGVIFHLYNAIFMGLNSFFWAFLSTYPAIIYVNLQVQGFK